MTTGTPHRRNNRSTAISAASETVDNAGSSLLLHDCRDRRHSKDEEPSQCQRAGLLVLGMSFLIGMAVVLLHGGTTTATSSSLAATATHESPYEKHPKLPMRRLERAIVHSIQNKKKRNHQPSQQIQPQHVNLRQLQFQDLKIGRFLANGSINHVYQVTLPQWWYEQQQVQHNSDQHYPNSNTTYVIKIANPIYGKVNAQREALALQTLNEHHPTLARQLQITPLIWAGGDAGIDNPYYHDPTRPLPEQAPPHLRRHPKLLALVVPDETPQQLNWDVLDDKDHEDYPLQHYANVKRFAYTLLRTLDYAHSLGVNTNDIQSANVHCDGHGNAIVSDWNEWKQRGEPIYDASMNFHMVPPEGHWSHFPVVSTTSTTTTKQKNDDDMEPQQQQHQVVRQTSVGAYDIWSVGIMLARIVWEEDCSLMRLPLYDHRERGEAVSAEYFEYLYRRGLGDDGQSSRIVLNDAGEWTDLAAVVNLEDRSAMQESSRQWKLPICETEGYRVLKYKTTCRPCQDLAQRGVLAELYNDSAAEKEDDKSKRLAAARQESNFMIDLIRQMLTIPLQERPSAAQLLQHPLFRGMSLEQLAAVHS